MKVCPRSIVKYILLFSFLLLSHTEAALATENKRHVVRMSGHVPNKAIGRAVFLEKLDAEVHVPMTLGLQLRNQQALVDLVQRMYDPSDKLHYGKYITTEQFVEQFAPTQEDYDAVLAYVKELGLTVTGTHPNRMLVNISGQAKSVESAFNVQLDYYMSPQGRKFYAPTDNPEIASHIASLLSGVVGLDNHAVWRPHYRMKTISTEHHLVSGAKPRAFPSGPAGGFSPSDISTAYNLKNISADGAGQVIALFELATYQQSDIDAYTNNFGLPAAKLTNVLVDGGSRAQIDAEVTLDIQLALAVAPKSEVYVYEGPNSNQGVLNTYNRIATDNIAKQVSTSWGVGENFVSTPYLQAENAIFLQMASQGQTIFAAAGDSGAYDDYQANNSEALVVDDPASQPYVVGVGGTTLTVDPDTGAYSSESIWNNGVGQGAGGGGVSQRWAIPSWQANVSTAYSTKHRNVPDVALNADPNTGYSIFFNGQWTIVGGTSCAAPLWAGFTALVNQERILNQSSFLGFANPILYAICSGGSYTADFHDVTSGDNLFYHAATGYDNASGWGTFNGASLWQSLVQAGTTPAQSTPVVYASMMHTNPFKKGKIGSYHISVSNTGSAVTSGPITVKISLPAGLSLHSFSGSGWNFNKKNMTFTQNQLLQPHALLPLLTLKTKVSAHAAHLLTPTVSISGGGAASSSVSDPTTVK